MNPFASPQETANQLSNAQLHPGTFEAAQFYAFESNLKTAGTLAGIVFLTLLLLAVFAIRRGQRGARPMLIAITSVAVVSAVSSLSYWNSRRLSAEASLRKAHEEAIARIKPWQPPLLSIPAPEVARPTVLSREERDALIGERPKLTVIQTNCASTTGGTVACTGTMETK